MFNKIKPAPEVLYFRKQHVIRDPEDKVIFTGEFRDGKETFPSINAAKRKMRELVEAAGPGSGRVVT